MPLYKMQMSFGGDTALLRDRIVNTFYLNDQGVGSDPDSLASDAIGVFQTFYGANRYGSCTVYEVAGSPPHYPVGFAEVNVGSTPQSSNAREVALCLSYFATRNLPRQRGRIYLCAPFNGSFSVGRRPTEGWLTAALDVGDGIAGLGGVDVDWQAYSPTDGQGRNVTNTWCDDEWDTIRSRGLDATTRDELAIDE